MAPSAINKLTQFRVLIQFLLKDLMRDGWRTAITVANLLTFLCCYFCLAALARAANEYGNDEEDRSSLMILQNNVFDPSDSIVTGEQILPIRERMPDLVSAVSPVIFRFVKVNNELIQLRAAASVDFQTVFRLALSEGAWPRKPDDVVIGSGTALMTGWTVGNQVNIFGRNFEVSGIVNTPGIKSSSIWMDLESAEALFGTSGDYQFLWVNITPGVNAADVVALLQNDSRIKNHYQVYFVDHLYQQYTRALDDVAGTSNVLMFISLITVMLGTFGSVYLTLSERSRELNILRAIGLSGRAIHGILSIRTLIQLAVAFLGSWLCSILILNYLSGKFPIIARSILLEVKITPAIFFTGLVLTILFGWIGVSLPMIRITKANVHSTIAR